MSASFLTIDPRKEVENIVTFLQKVTTEQHINSIVLGLSGGIDSTVSFYLLQKAFSPEQIIAARLSYFPSNHEAIDDVLETSGIPSNNIYQLSIKPIVDAAQKVTAATSESQLDTLRLGNIMARSRMITLYDLAKKHHALVCGTENKSEMLLGYFTRFGDEASDIEPIRHLYKTQVYALAEYLSVPEAIIKQAPTAGLWQGQTDEGQFGFTYAEADEVLYWYNEQHLPLEVIKRKGYKNAEKIVNQVEQNAFKHHVPYSL